MLQLSDMTRLKTTAEDVVVDRCGVLCKEYGERLLYEPNLLHIRMAVATGCEMKCHADLSWRRETVIEVLADLLRNLTAH